MSATLNTSREILELEKYIESLDEIFQNSVTVSNTRSEVKLGWITADDVIFVHANTSQSITMDNFGISAGQIVSVQGESGQGKSTIMDLLAGLRIPSKGEIKAVNTDGVRITPTTATISQEAELFNLSLYENITLGVDISRTEIANHLDQVNLGAWLASLPDGLDTVLGKKGLHLSAGQK